MSEKIEPALSAEEWRDALDPDMRDGLASEVCYLWGRQRPAGAIAIANAALPASDVRKITREMLDDFDSCAAWAAGEGQPELADRAQRHIRALQSYLPPE